VKLVSLFSCFLAGFGDRLPKWQYKGSTFFMFPTPDQIGAAAAAGGWENIL
jgi:hypothetical protein